MLRNSSPGDFGLDDPRTTDIRKTILRSKPFLMQIYRAWYSWLARGLPDVRGPVVELGSGPGFLEEYIPGLVTTEITWHRGLSAVLDAQLLPFQTNTLRAIVCTNVMHHLPSVRAFLREGFRCLRPGGKILMIEPWLSRWSRIIYGHFHHEPFQPNRRNWDFASSGPLSGSNQALPWMVFERDRQQFEHEFPMLRIAQIEPCMPLAYLLSGGYTAPALAPVWAFRLIRRLERLLPNAAMLAGIVLERQKC